MAETIVGARIRELRRQAGITQAALARDVGISASYLNLIERNKRRIAGARLHAIAERLGVRTEDLDGSEDLALAQALRDIAGRPDHAQAAPEADAVGELIGRYPGWARVLQALEASEQAAHRAVHAMSVRVTEDPFLGDLAHRMMSRAAAIRSASEILMEYDDIGPDERARFDRIVAEEAQRLAEVGEALGAFFDRVAASAPTLTPVEDVDAFLAAHRNRFPRIEASVVDPSQAIAGLIRSHDGVATETAQKMAASLLERYAEDAARMPLDAMLARCREMRLDIEAIADAFGVPFEVAARRLTALPQEVAPDIGYLAINAAGAVVELIGLPDLSVPRFAHLCPLWGLFRASMTPGRTVVQHAVFPNGARWLFIARTRNLAPASFGRAPVPMTDMIFLAAGDAIGTVYESTLGAEPDAVGPTCRVCPRETCVHRVEDPFSPQV